MYAIPTLQLLTNNRRPHARTLILGDLNFVLSQEDRRHDDGSAPIFHNRMVEFWDKHFLNFYEYEQPLFTCKYVGSDLSKAGCSKIDRIYDSLSPLEISTFGYACNLLNIVHQLSDHAPVQFVASAFLNPLVLYPRTFHPPNPLQSTSLHNLRTGIFAVMIPSHNLCTASGRIPMLLLTPFTHACVRPPVSLMLTIRITQSLPPSTKYSQYRHTCAHYSLMTISLAPILLPNVKYVLMFP